MFCRYMFPGIQLAVVAFIVMVMAGCTSLPQQVGYGFKKQKNMQSVRHWQVLADDVARQILLVDFENAGEELRLYVESPPGAFGKAFTRMINASLLGHSGTLRPGVDVIVLSRQEPECNLVKVSAQVVRYRSMRGPQFFPGTFTLLSSGIAVMRNLEWNGSLVVAGALTDVFLNTGNPDISKSELVITTSIEKDGHYLFMRNDLYYLSAPDASLYNKPVPRSVRSYPLAGS